MYFKSLVFTSSIGLLALMSSVPASADTITNATLPAPGFYNGGGNPSTDFVIANYNNLSLALGVKTAFGDPPATVEDPGSANYEAPNGTVDRTYSCCGTETLAQWDYYFSIDTQSTVDQYQFRVTIKDLNTGHSKTYDPLTALTDNSGLLPNQTTFTNGSFNAATDAGIQNAENIGFTDIGFGGNGWLTTELPTDAYSVTLAAYASGTFGANGPTPLDTVTVTVNAAPEPGTIVMMLGSLCVLAFFARRRRNA